MKTKLLDKVEKLEMEPNSPDYAHVDMYKIMSQIPLFSEKSCVM